VLTVGYVGGEIWGGRLCIWVIFTHLGCFGARGRAGRGRKIFATRARSPGYQLGKRCQLGLGSELLLGSLGSVFRRKKCAL